MNGEQLKKVIKTKGFTLKELSIACGKSPNWLGGVIATAKKNGTEMKQEVVDFCVNFIDSQPAREVKEVPDEDEKEKRPNSMPVLFIEGVEFAEEWNRARERVLEGLRKKEAVNRYNDGRGSSGVRLSGI